MSDRPSKLNATTDFLYFWDEVHGWVHISEVEKLREARKRFEEGKESEVK